jgi:hypothetical protein
MMIDEYYILLLLSCQAGWLEVENVSPDRFIPVFQDDSHSLGVFDTRRL